MWLEIEADRIVGVHSEKSTHDCRWVELKGEQAHTVTPGDRWEKGQVIPRRNDRDPVAEKRQAARAHITAVYPLWKQLNLLRAGDQTAIAKMGRFIDATRDWSNSATSNPDQLNNITP